MNHAPEAAPQSTTQSGMQSGTQTAFNVVIPARLASTRLPNKPLADIAGKPMVVRVFEQASRSAASVLVVATDALQIVDACASHGISAVMTRADHATGTDRLAQIVDHFGWDDDAIVVNVQGDEPLIDPTAINAVAQALALAPTCAVATCAHPIVDTAEIFNPNVVKAALRQDGRALYFSRSALPYFRESYPHSPSENPPTTVPGLVLRHIGLYAYRARFLRDFAKLAPTPLEQAESLEQLRALENGFDIHVHVLPHALAAGVDTQEDLDRVRALFAAQP